MPKQKSTSKSSKAKPTYDKIHFEDQGTSKELGLQGHHLSEEYLEQVAIKSGSVKFWRQMKTGTTLLRALWLWASLNQSMRFVAGWLAYRGIAFLSEGALRYRFRHAEPFLRKVLSGVFNDQINSSRKTQLLLFDASTLTEGEKRLHVSYDPLHQRLHGVDIDDKDSGESFGRLPETGDFYSLIVGDSHYGRANQINMAQEKGYVVLARTYLPTLHPRSMQNDAQQLELSPLLHLAKEQNGYETKVRIRSESGRLTTVRLLILPLSEESARRARQKVRDTAKRKQRTASAENLEQAGYLCLVTTLLDETVAPMGQLFDIYRLRWQIELFFKRAKSISGLDQFSIQGDDIMKRVCLLAKLLHVCLVLRNLVCKPLTIFKRHQDGTISVGKLCQSLWRQWQMLFHEHLFIILGVGSLSALEHIRFDDSVLSRLCERPRKRKGTPSLLHHLQQHLGTLFDGSQQVPLAA